jgi:Domain of unknown function DUF29
MTTADYDTDFYSWTQAQAAGLRAKDRAALNLEHLAEGIESVGWSNRFALESQLVRVLLHLLKPAYDPATRPRRGRRVTAASAREELAKRAMGGLQPHPAATPRWRPGGRSRTSPRPAPGRLSGCWTRTSGRSLQPFFVRKACHWPP